MSKTCVVQQECHTEMSLEKSVVHSEIKSVDHSTVLWPLLTKSAAGSKHSSQVKQNLPFQPNILLRSGSLDRIRQFPAYLCRRGSNSVLFWLYQSRSTFREVLSSAHEQLRGLFLVFCVYLAIGLIAAQFVICFLIMSVVATSLPSGFIFLFCCIVLIAVIGIKSVMHTKEVPLHHHHHS